MIVSVSYKNPDHEVKEGLSLSPAEIEKMTAQGKAAAIGSQDGAQYFDNTPNGSPVAFEKMRGVSINDAWRFSQLAKKRIMDNRAKAKLRNVQNQQNSGDVVTP